MEEKEITGKEWIKYGIIYPLALILIAALAETISRMF